MLVVLIGVGALFILGGLRALGLALSLIQRLLDKAQHKFPLGELASGAGILPLQMGFDALEKGFIDLDSMILLLFVIASLPPFSFILKYSVSRLVMYWAVVRPAYSRPSQIF